MRQLAEVCNDAVSDGFDNPMLIRSSNLGGYCGQKRVGACLRDLMRLQNILLN